MKALMKTTKAVKPADVVKDWMLIDPSPCVNAALNKRAGCAVTLRGLPRCRAYTERVRVAAVGVTFRT